MKHSLILLFAIMLLCSSCINQQSEYRLTGITRGFSDSTEIILYDFEYDTIVNTTYVKRDKFKLRGKLPEPKQFVVFSSNQVSDNFDYKVLWVGHSRITLRADHGRLATALVKGSEIQLQDDLLEGMLQDVYFSTDSVYMAMGNLDDTDSVILKKLKVREEENQNLGKNYQKYKEKGFEIIGVSLDRTRANWERVVNEDSMVWTTVSDLQGRKGGLAVKYNITFIPRSFLINPEGVIVAVDLRGDELGEMLNEMLIK